VDRDKIERRDFPTGRRGYDPTAVDEHLRRVADQFEARVDPPAQSLSSGASEQVRGILEAAERSAAELRAKAGEDAFEHVERVQQAADGMLAKLDELEAELGGLLASLRASGERLTLGLADLHAEVARGRGDLAPAPDAAGGGSAPRDLAAADSAAPDLSADGSGPADAALAGSAAPDLAAAGSAPRDAADGGSAPPAGSALPDPAPAGDAPATAPDEAGARLIALNMALSGSSREDTARYLADHLALADAAALLEDVYERAGR
jgi:DivIVA domain-containing protein